MSDAREQPAAADSSSMRARIGAALRRQPTALNPCPSSVAPESAAEAVAAALAAAAPGLALMLQLRARAFDDAVAVAPRRGIRLLVSLGGGLDGRLHGGGTGRDLRAWEVDTEPGLAARSAAAGVERAAVADVDAEAWAALRRRRVPLATDRTLFLIHNAFLWSTRAPLERFLAHFAAGAACGSELVLNVLDDEEAGPGTLALVAPAYAAAGGRGLVRLSRRLHALGLATVAACDTGDLQQRYLGRNDVLAREFLLWIRKGGTPPGTSMTALLGRPPAAARSVPTRGVEPRPSASRVCIARGSVRVVVPRARGALAREVATDAGLLLRRIAGALGCAPLPALRIELSTGEPYRPCALGSGRSLSAAVVRIPVRQYSRPMLAHELVHVLARAASIWLGEGLAVWTQRRVAPGPCFPDDASPVRGLDPTGVGLRLAEWLGAPAALPVALRPLARRPGRGEYRRAASFVGFFVEGFGLARLRALLEADAHSARDEALARVCRSVGCVSLAVLEARWLAAIRARSGEQRR